ncbi:uncharacterized protein LOC110689493 [Chenopodium quinoa]|uniref:uncharacterized protein LOC110689493 n=1 Tax=Chenopodium quinoa TaxID=63459 RepID=UPI000B773FCC|nr:uncharacterized protein LOC110689493 [Chenopodium quinoa]
MKTVLKLSFKLSESIVKFLFRFLQELQGDVPNNLGNLSRLISLDLNSISLVHRVFTEDYDFKLNVRSLSWLSRLTYLRFMNLNGVDLGKVTDWLQIISNLPHLRVLHLDDCNLPALPPQIPSYQNSSTTLSVISLRRNYVIDDSIFKWLFNPCIS